MELVPKNSSKTHTFYQIQMQTNFWKKKQDSSPCAILPATRKKTKKQKQKQKTQKTIEKSQTRMHAKTQQIFVLSMSQRAIFFLNSPCSALYFLIIIFLIFIQEVR